MKVLQILVLIFGFTVFANSQNAEKMFVLSGTVFDSEKSVVPGTEITAENEDGRKFQTTSDEKGVYKISIPFGEYTIIFHKDGFKITKVIEFENSLLPEKSFDANLEVGTCYDCNGDLYGENDSDKRNPKEVVLSDNRNTNQIFLTGIVTDQFGAIIQKAKIKVAGNKQKLTAETDENGLYKIKLSEGIYTIEFEASGHKSYKIKEYRIRSIQQMSLDVALYANPTPII
jgi:Carboxypeptidase regulatory-like domain